MSAWRLSFPGDLDASEVARFLRTLAGRPGRTRQRSLARPVTFVTVLEAAAVHWLLEGPDETIESLRLAASRLLPGIGWEAADLDDGHDIAKAAELRLVSPDRLLAVTDSEPAVGSMLALSHRLRPTERVRIQWDVGGALHRSPVPAASQGQQPRTIWNLPEWGTPARTPEEVSSLRAKTADHLFAAVGRVAVSGADPKRAEHLIGLVLATYRQLRAPGVGLVRRPLPSALAARRLRRSNLNQLNPPVRAAAAELAALIAWPIGGPRLPGVRYVRAPRRPFDARLLRPPKHSDRSFGRSTYPDHTTGSSWVVQSIRDSLRHTLITGSTGAGKSELAARLILADIAAGRGLCVLDPQGDLVDRVLERVPPDRLDAVAVLDPTDEAPIGFNPLAEGPLGVDGVIHVLRASWESWGPRVADTLESGLRSLALSPGRTLPELGLLLTDPAFARPIMQLAMQRDPLGVGSWWPWYQSLSDEMRAQVLAPVMSRLRALLVRPEIRNVIGQAEPRFDLNDIFTGRRALLVRLPKGQLGSGGAQMLGALLVSHLWRLIQRRSALPSDRRHPVGLYLDEFPDFLRLPIDFADALVRSRSMGVGLVLLHQHLDQLDRSTRAAALANCGSKLFFRLDYDDAASVARRTDGQLTADNFSNLAAYEAYASILSDGDATPYGSLRTVPLGAPRGRTEPLLIANRQRWGVPASETEERLRRLQGGGADPPRGLLGGRPVSEPEP